MFSPQKWFEYLRQIMVFGEYRGGQLIGMDRLGNRYYEIKDVKRMFPCTPTRTHKLMVFHSFICI